MKIPSGKIFRHWKGGHYELICFAFVEGSNGTDQNAVYCDQDGKVWTRPSSEFFEKITHPETGEIVPRFTLVFGGMRL